ncbi:arabinosyltransferase domain-containing protein [Saccharothrix sp. AJ9571]|nr:arabinosyltransferase domain-containing protein [Saccharothrix sp. AJ9571]
MVSATAPAMARAVQRRPGARPRPFRRSWLALPLATIAVALAIPFAPVEAEQAEVLWPRAGQPARSSVAMFLPYRPLELEVAVACAAVATAAPGATTTAFATFPADAEEARGQGLALQIRDRQLVSVFDDREHPLGPVPTGDCEYRVHAGGGGLRTTVRSAAGERELLRADALVPQVVAFVTDLPADGTAGAVSARAQADARFQTSPAPLKVVLMVAFAVGALGCVIAGFRIFGHRRGSPGARLAWRSDAAWTGLVGAGIAAWGVLGPQTVDDGWFLGMHRNLGASGFAGDYYMALNAAETPAILLQYLFAPLFQVSWAPLMTRVPAMVAGLAIWLLLLGITRLLRRHTDAVRVPTSLLAAAFAVVWMSGGVGLRPEPFVVLCTGISAYTAVRARLTGNPGWLIVGGLAAGACFAVTSTGMLALIPLALGVLVTADRLPVDRPPVLFLALVAAAVAVASPLVFLDSGIGGFADSAGARYWYGAAQSWYGEFSRYQMLLGGVADDFTFEQHPARRLPVLLSIALLVIVIVLSPRHQPGHTFSGVFSWPFAWLGLGLAALLLTPTKIASHFSALDFFAALVIAYGLAALPRAFARERAGWVIRFSVLFVITVVISLVWYGPNSWWGYHRFGMPFLDRRLADGLPADPAVLLLFGGVAAGVLLLGQRRRGVTGGDDQPWPTRLAGWTAIVLAGTSVAAMPVLLMGLHGKAALNQHAAGSWSPVHANLDSITGQTCGAADAVRLADGGTLHERVGQVPGPVLVDWPISVWYPCARLPVLADGLVEPPVLLLRAPHHYGHHGDLTRSYRPYGGAFAALGSVATYREVPASLPGHADPAAWGTLSEVHYRYPTDGFDKHVTTTTKPGWWRGPSYAGEDYTGQPAPS